MTTTGDLFVNIKGNNKGFKQTLDQTNRQMDTFSQKAQKSMGSIPGIGPALTGAASAAGAGAFLLEARRIKNKGQLSSMMETMREGKRQIDGIYQNRRHAAFNGDIGRYRFEHSKLSRARAHRRETIEKMKGHRDAVLSASNTLRAPLRLLKNPMFIAAVGGVAAGALVSGVLANSTKWQKRMNTAGERYSGVVAANKARISAANVRRDVSLARDPLNQGSAMFRQNAADYRKNSGDPTFGRAANNLGAAWDYTIGFLNNALTRSLAGGVI